MRQYLGTAYLIHLERPLAHARHYIGWTDRTPEERLADHRSGAGACMLAAAAKAGIEFTIVRTWPRKDRNFERCLKKRHDTHALCPICRAKRIAYERNFAMARAQLKGRLRNDLLQALMREVPGSPE